MGTCQNSLTTSKACIHSGEFGNNQPVTQVVHKNDKGEVLSVFDTNEESPMPIPPVVMAEKKKESKVVVQANADGESNRMPPVVLAEVGDKSSSMIRTGEDDALDRMRKCQPEGEETPMVMPAAVGKDKNK